MPGAFLLGLVSDRDVALAQGALDLVPAFADHDHALACAEAVDPVEQVQKQRLRRDRVQHLVRVGTHPRPLARGEDHDGEIGHLAHPPG